jgi:hypothetical protein
MSASKNTRVRKARASKTSSHKPVKAPRPAEQVASLVSRKIDAALSAAFDASFYGSVALGWPRYTESFLQLWIDTLETKIQAYEQGCGRRRSIGGGK